MIHLKTKSESKKTKRSFLRGGFTFLELIISLSLTSLLMLALGSVILLSTQTLKLHEQGPAKSAEAFQLASKIMGDIKLAIEFTEQTPTATTFTVPDRDGDGQVETIRYAWENLGTTQLTKSVDLSGNPDPPNANVIAEDVPVFEFEYSSDTRGRPIDTIVETTTPQPIYFHDDEPDQFNAQLAMIVGNDNSLTSSEQDQKAQFESWGYTVTLIDDGEPKEDYQSAIAANHVIFLSPDADPALLNSKLKNAEIGIVNGNGEACELLQFGSVADSSRKFSVGNMVFETHYVTAGHTRGGVRFLSSHDSIPTVNSDPALHAPDLITVIDGHSEPAMMILDKQSESFDSSLTIGQFGNSRNGGELADPAGLVHTQAASLFTLTNTVKVSSLAASLTADSPSIVRFGIYLDEDGEPSSLLGETGSVPVAFSKTPTWITGNLGSETKLEPGKYWLAIAFDNDVAFELESGGQSKYFDPGFDPTQGMAGTWGTSYKTKSSTMSIFANYIEVPTAKGRRVHLPLGSVGFDWSLVSKDGIEIVERALKWAADTTPEDNFDVHEISSNSELTECFQPAALPTNVLGWSISEASIKIRRNADNPTGQMQFTVYRADTNDQPTGPPLAQTALIPTSVLDSQKWVWFSIPFLQTDWIDPTEKACLVVSGSSTETDIFVAVDSSLVATDGNVGTQAAAPLDPADPSDPVGEPGPVGPVDPADPEPVELDKKVRLYTYGLFQTDGAPQW